MAVTQHAMTTLTLPAPAKLNLFLHITGRRDDGYHTLQTLFQLIDCHDELSFTARHDRQITLHSNLPEVACEQNLVVKAAQLLKNHTHCRFGVDITLAKRLALGGGLGGGSSDAATTLLGLNQLWQLGLHEDELASLGTRLGADVPVFVRGKTAWAEGVGEVLTPVDLPPVWYLIIHPNCTVSTAAIFAHKDLTRTTAPITMAAFLAQGGHNDCEAIVRKLYPEVDMALNWLATQSPTARMTGTGACVFATFDSHEEAHRAWQNVPAAMRAFIAKGMNESLLHLALRQ